ncbi:hypothetical protein OS493_027118 [Desmophyllum pertusum]|uniref:Uncharacterized protein n=1 Tax=Desmophyllum pertusum TaxID=174260 RepID=A0A9X0D918_9CNID|nr:hypothetical protein OS493_027118 [Desmophyllum pertusum]
MDSERVNVGAHLHPAYPHVLNSAKVINLASLLSSSVPWRVENTQMSDLSVWFDFQGRWNWDWAKTLPDTLDLCNFEADSHVSGRLGTGRKQRAVCRAMVWGLGLALRLSEVIFEAVVGDGFLGDIAIDEVKLLTESVLLLQIRQRQKAPSCYRNCLVFVLGPSLEKSAIVGHLSGFKLFLLKALADAGKKDRIWVPCYRALTDGKRPKGVALSFKAFLFSLNNNQGTDPKSFYLKTDRRHSAHFAKSDQGPTFGDGDLVLETMSSGYSELGNSFDIGADAAFQFAGARNFVISDVEVLTTEDNMCGSKCNHPEGRCDEITGKCICDGEGRNVEWCLEGEPKKIFNLYKDGGVVLGSRLCGRLEGPSETGLGYGSR